MTIFTDEIMQQMLSTSRPYAVMILKGGPNINQDGARSIVWQHGKRNFELRESGVLSIVCPIADGGDIKGLGIFNTSAEEVKKIMDEDPAVKAGIFTYEVHNSRSFPGDSLPEK